ncbi:GLPGLI family protein [Flavobacterium sp. DG1-102-2]|uniref:GLPGLI family protein n=1 Tax=Flavobacterium sp. DG1-102-2 TaxID=3081663 RepID=UPI00294A68C2|nr:GLPGLI family protein [Flavobacterium sp. DG1-102-2]MDV6167518.1 GLPGLI family protein [Flavobacterium sp. DG1-102-2]
MKKTISTTFLFIYLFSNAQKSNDVQVEYQAFFDTNLPMKMHTTLYVSGNVAVYHEKYNTKESWTEKIKPDNELAKMAFSSPFPPEDSYYRIDCNKKEMLFFDDIMRNKFLVKDVFPDPEWKITDETKTVAGLQCIKASASFRGREWTAWFTPEIPLAFGPWKLQGLPGIILEAYDSTNRYTFKAVKIEFKKSDIITKNFAKIYETKNSKPVTYQKFLDDKAEATANFHAEMQQELKGKGGSLTINTPPRSGEELHFEWEP